MRTRLAALTWLLCFASASVLTRDLPKTAQAPSDWRDPSPHASLMVTADAGVSVEILNWGGKGAELLVLAGSGHSAHVFDDIAPKLTATAHVYGMTRRGWGASSQPATGYDNQRLADDVLAVLDALSLKRPILVGHSAAGHEMTTLARQHPDRVGGLIFLDALADSASDPSTDAEWRALLPKLPPPGPRPACTQDRTSFAAFRQSRQCEMGFALPEADLRNTYTVNSDGSVGQYKTSQEIRNAMGAGHQAARNYEGIRVPALALFEFPRTSLEQLRPEDPQPRTDEERAIVLHFAALTKRIVDRASEKLIASVPQARLVNLPGAGHYVFITKEREVIDAIAAFVSRR